MRESNRLSAVKVTKLRKAGRYCDGLGLYLQVGPSGTKSWLFRYMLNGRAREMGLGAVHTVTLAEAREKAAASRKLLLEGIDPIEARRKERIALQIMSARAVTFRQCAERYIESQRAGWRNEKHAKQWTATLTKYAYSQLGDLPVAAVDVDLVLRVLEPIWRAKPETAARVRGRIEATLDWATARGLRDGDNPARWRGHLDKLLPPRSKLQAVVHYPALDYAQIPEFMAELRQRDGIGARALELLILCATRTGETIGAQWSEFDLGVGVWVIPASRTKAAREHRVPLSKRSVEILNTLPREVEFVFPGAREKSPMSNMTLLKLLRRMGRRDLAVHGFRSSFRDWAAEQTNYPREVAEMALAHVVADKTEAAYRRGDLFEKRQRLMSDWAKFCASQPQQTGDVVPIRAAGPA